MDERLKALTRLPVQSPHAVLLALYELRQKINAGEPIKPPQISLTCGSGRTLRGTVLNLGADEAGTQVLLQSPDWDLHYVPLDTIESIAIHQAGELNAATLTILGATPESSPPLQDRRHPIQTETRAPEPRAPELKFSPPPAAATNTPGSSRESDLPKRLGDYSAQISQHVGLAVTFEVRWDAIPKNATAQQSLVALAREALATVLEVTSIPERLSVFRRRIRKIRLQNAVVPLVGTEAETLVLAANLSEGNSGRYGLQQLRQEIEEILDQ